MRDKLKRQGTQTVLGKSDDGVVPVKSGNADGGKAVTSEQRSMEGTARTQRRKEPVITRLERISQRAKEAPRDVFTNLFQHLDYEMLEQCFREEKRDKAPGVDRVTKEQYGQELGKNLERLVQRLHRGSYRPLPVRRRYIPKAGGKRRPLGIPALEDKLVQRAVAKVLERVYEEKFYDFSYGFRPGRSCHDALRRLSFHIGREKTSWVVEADIASFYDNVDHGWLLQFVAHRVGDPRLLRLIRRFLEAGVMVGGRREATMSGVPQGGPVSCVLANVYLHCVLDDWFAKVVVSHSRGAAHLVRYADDFVVCFQYEEDARRFLGTLPKRLGRFALAVAPSKTRILRFGRFARRDAVRAGAKVGTFEFLGLQHYCGRSRAGRFKLKWRTAPSRFRSKLRELRRWVRTHLTLPTKELWRLVIAKLRGHYGYYGVSDNWPLVFQFRRQVYWLMYRAMNRRSQRRSFNLSSWAAYVDRHGLPNPGKLVDLNPFTFGGKAPVGSRMR